MPEPWGIRTPRAVDNSGNPIHLNVGYVDKDLELRIFESEATISLSGRALGYRTIDPLARFRALSPSV